jgi:hypothetical protein
LDSSSRASRNCDQAAQTKPQPITIAEDAHVIIDVSKLAPFVAVYNSTYSRRSFQVRNYIQSQGRVEIMQVKAAVAKATTFIRFTMTTRIKTADVN